ncbi:MAG: universal stress protein [Alphaproteobacteria bacterium]|nr:universal stress protein [Alphaproteobacteria bacterium]MDX5368088.1 universal stress protein [Alphaproteobacteria bacterium]MDX5462927.1 universal stress protein [Alphaproteobacteria bacterium]
MFNRILVPVDLDEENTIGNAVRAASDLAKQHGAELRLLTVLPVIPASVSLYMPEDVLSKRVDESKAALANLAKETDPSLKVTTVVRKGTIYDEVIREAEAADCDLIVMTSHRPEMSTYLLGSNAARIVRHSNCSVLVLRPKD